MDKSEDESSTSEEPTPIEELTDPQLFERINRFAEDIASARDRPVLSLLYPAMGQVAPSDALRVYQEFLYHNQLVDLDIILHSGGGDIHEAYDIIKLCRKHTTGEVTVFVPIRAMSAATLIALGADKVVLSDIGKLGPLDPQIQHPEYGGYMPVRSVTDIPTVLEKGLTSEGSVSPEVKGEAIIKPIAKQVDPYILTMHERTTDLARDYGKKILTDRGYNIAMAERCIDYLIEYPSHSYSVDLREIKENKSLSDVINASGFDELSRGDQIEFALTYLISFYEFWDRQYQNLGEPRGDPRIEMVFPPEPSQKTLDDVATEVPDDEIEVPDDEIIPQLDGLDDVDGSDVDETVDGDDELDVSDTADEDVFDDIEDDGMEQEGDEVTDD